MPKLLSRPKHEEFKSNSALQIINEKERRAENARKLEYVGNLVGFEIFATCEISQVAKSPPATVHSSYHYSPFPVLLPFLTLLSLFGLLPKLPLM